MSCQLTIRPDVCEQHWLAETTKYVRGNLVAYKWRELWQWTWLLPEEITDSVWLTVVGAVISCFPNLGERLWVLGSCSRYLFVGRLFSQHWIGSKCQMRSFFMGSSVSCFVWRLKLDSFGSQNVNSMTHDGALQLSDFTADEWRCHEVFCVFILNCSYLEEHIKKKEKPSTPRWRHNMFRFGALDRYPSERGFKIAIWLKWKPLAF